MFLSVREGWGIAWLANRMQTISQCVVVLLLEAYFHGVGELNNLKDFFRKIKTEDKISFDT